MSILNVNQIQPVGSGQTITVSASNITASTATVTANKFVGDLTGSTGSITGNVDGNINSTGISTFSVIAGVSTIGVGQTIHANSVGVGTNLSDVNDLNYPIIFNTGTYSNFERKPGIVWRSDNSLPTIPKNSIFTREHGAGSELHFATSNNYATGITTSAYVDQEGRFVSSQSTYAYANATGTQTRATASGWIKITLNSFFASNVTFDNANDRFVIIDPGIYHIIAEIDWSASNSGGAWTPSIGIYRNGSTDVFHSYLHEGYNSGYSSTIMISRTRPLDEGDQIELWWQQNTSSTNTFSDRSHLTIMKVI